MKQFICWYYFNKTLNKNIFQIYWWDAVIKKTASQVALHNNNVNAFSNSLSQQPIQFIVIVKQLTYIDWCDVQHL